ncbi:hypothetical protein GGF32_009204 [Allomyces javanicus]|nr:hypothetical protein GGF32_009204 [Allomyces javanicus]
MSADDHVDPDGPELPVPRRRGASPPISAALGPARGSASAIFLVLVVNAILLAVLLFSGPSLLPELDRTHHDSSAPLHYDPTRLALHYLPVKAGKSVAVVDTHLIWTNSSVDGGIEIVDWLSGYALARVPFGRVKWMATISGTPWIAAWSSIWSELTLFKVDAQGRLEKVAAAWQGDEDAVGICAGTSVVGEQVVALLQKGGVVQIYRIVSQADSVVLQKVQ